MTNIITDGNGSSFVVGDYIDKGSFSKVYTLECCKTKRQFAGKFMCKEKLQKYGLAYNVSNEIKIHQKLHHRNIVEFHSFIEQQKHIIIILEFCSRYSMVNILHALKTFTLNEAKYFMLQIVSAVRYLHEHYIVHRDLKLGNLFVNKQLQVKLGDFGLAVAIEYSGQKRFSRCGTPNYIAPEVINGVGHSFEVDVWALGCILYTMMEGTPPFQEHNTTSTYNKILKCEYRFSPKIDIKVRAFIKSSLQADPKNRPTVFQLAMFEFITSKDILPKPPQFNFTDDKKLSLVKKTTQVTEKGAASVCNIKEKHVEKYPKACLLRLSNYLSKIKKLPDSQFGEFLAETSSIVPLVWVNSWMDYSNEYGFAYLLSNKNFGLIFNDRTRMLRQVDEQVIRYVSSNGYVFACKENCVPNPIKKKFKILTASGKYMSDSLIQAYNMQLSECDPQTTNTSTPVEVYEWVRGEEEVAMFLSNGSVQVNFASDHTKLVVCDFTMTVTVIETHDYMKTLNLNTLQKLGCSKTLKDKLLVVSNYINNYLSA